MGKSFLIVVNVLITIAAVCARRETPPADTCGLRQKPSLVRSFAEGRFLYGVQVIDKEVYIIRDFQSYIEVYDRYTFQPKRNISIENLGRPYNLVQSRHDSSGTSLFVLDYLNDVNLNVVKMPSGTVTQWSFQEPNRTIMGLAGSNRYTGANILITTMVTRKVKEFTPDGKLVSEFTLRDILMPRHTIKVASDRYVVSDGYGPPPELHQICLVNGNGEKIKCYGGLRGSGVGQLNTPGRMELSKKNCILVADVRNKKLLLFNQNLEYVRNLIDEDLEAPYRYYLDEKESLLYVAENTVEASGRVTRGRVKVFKI